MTTTQKEFAKAERRYSDHWPTYEDAKIAYREGRIGDDEFLAIREEHERLLADWDRAYAALSA